MKTLTLQVKLLTSALIGSGTGYGALIDSDIVLDSSGIPYIPAKRIKGCLRDSAAEVCEYFKQADIKLFDISLITRTFGETGSDEPGGVYFSNLTIEDYHSLKEWLDYLFDEPHSRLIINREAIINYFTELREHTSIDEDTGTAKDGSLRTIRVAKKGLVFTGGIDIIENNPEIEKLLYFAVKNLRHMGTKRTRGFGNVECKLFDKEKELNFMDELEELCK